MSIKLIAIDLDGTLFDRHKHISATNRKYLNACEQHGIQVVICTGRPLAAIQDTLESLDLMGDQHYSITFNGGLVQHNHTGEQLEHLTLTKAQVADIYEVCHAMDLPMDVVHDDTVYHLQSRYPSLYGKLNPKMQFLDCTIDALDDNINYNKVLVSQEQDYLDARVPALVQRFKPDYSVMKTQPTLLELAHPLVSKAHGLEVLGRHLHIAKEEMMAIGDEENDISMLQYAGLGVAMGNASDEAKAAANVITTTNDDDGVAHAIKTWVLN